MNALLKSGQPELIYSKALEYYQKEKWQRASTLFEGVQHYYTGSSREDSISFFNARCKYKNRDFDTASTLLDDFRRKFGRSAFIEDAEGMYALCFYYLSPGPSRDQTMTGHALIAINEFMSRYPQSDRVENFRKINTELTERLHEKAYLNAYTYYKTGKYKSAIVAFKNALKQYPESKRREEIMYLIVDSGLPPGQQLDLRKADRPLPVDARLLPLVQGGVPRIDAHQEPRPHGPAGTRLPRPQ